MSILTLWGVLLILAIALSFLIPQGPRLPPARHLRRRPPHRPAPAADFADFHYLSQTHWLAWPARAALLASDIAALEFCRVISGTRRRTWFIAFEIFYAIAAASLLPAALGLISYVVYTALIRLSFYCFIAVLVVLIALGVRRRKQDAAILASVAGVYLFYLAVWKLLQYVVFSYDILTRISNALTDRIQPKPHRRNLPSSSRSSRSPSSAPSASSASAPPSPPRSRPPAPCSSSSSARLWRLPPASPSRPSTTPAGEVGGDFFLVSPTSDGAVTIIVGDVSGKGLLAAMRVSMILGVLRREPSRQPADMLFGLNEALLTQGEMGFTTAICVRVEPSGRYSVANAGHISPYVLGKEIDTPPALPLGLAGDQTYDTVSGRLNIGERLVLLSDGVPEARTPKGELYGFDRLSTPSPLNPPATSHRSHRSSARMTTSPSSPSPASPVTSAPAPPPPPVSSAIPPPPLVTA